MKPNPTREWLRKIVILGTPLTLGIVELWHPRYISLWIVGIISAAIALARAGAPRPPVILLGLSFIFWFSFVAPMNAQFAQWTVDSIPADWTRVRNQWEYSHATRFALTASIRSRFGKMSDLGLPMSMTLLMLLSSLMQNGCGLSPKRSVVFCLPR